MDKEQLKSIIENFKENAAQAVQGENPSQAVQDAVWDMLKQLNPEAFKNDN